MTDKRSKPHSPKKSDSCFALTDAIKASVLLQKTHDAVHRRLSAKLAEWGLSVPKYGVLLQLYDHGSLPSSKIGDLIFRCNSNLTTLIDRMERDGLVEKVNHTTDRRVKEIRLSAKGLDIAPKVIASAREFLDQIISGSLSTEEQRIFIDMMSRIRKQSEQTGHGEASAPAGMTDEGNDA
jgi:DNA-binding MarR family transcriptional regulator